MADVSTHRRFARVANSDMTRMTTDGKAKKNYPNAFDAACAKLRSWPVLFTYTLLFCFVAVIGFSPLIIEGKSIFSIYDGISQQFNSFVDVGYTVREAFKGLLAGQGFHIPAYDLSNGYGSGRYLTRDPLTYLSVICPTKYAETGFLVVSFVRLWLTGVSFMALGRELAFSRGAKILGALIYAFSAWGLHICYQTLYLNYLILFPIVVLGALRVVRNGRPWCFIVVGFVSCYIMGLYGFFMMCVLVAIGTIIYLVAYRASMGKWLKTLLLFVASFVVVFLICAPIIAREFATLSSLDRLSTNYDVPLLYTAKYYQEMLVGFLGLRSGGRDWMFGYGALALVCCLGVFVKKGTMPQVLRALLVVFTVMACVPVVGSTLNGGTYVANRWIFGYELLAACCVSFIASNRFEFSCFELRKLGIALAVYTCLVFLCVLGWSAGAFIQLVIAWLLFGLLVVLASGLRCSETTQRICASTNDGEDYLCSSHRRSRTINYIAILVVVALGLNYYLFLSPYGTNFQKTLYESGGALNRVGYATPAQLVKNSEVGLARYDQSYDLDQYILTYGLNASKVRDVYGVDFYSSLYNNAVDTFHGELALAASGIPNMYHSLDSRAYLQKLLGVSHFAVRVGDKSPMPYGLSGASLSRVKGADGKNYELRELNPGASMAYVFENAIDQADYLTLSPLQRQEALLQGVVLDGADMSGFGVTSIDPASTSSVLDFDYELGEGVSLVDGHSVVVTKKNASIILKFDGVQQVETYIYLDDYSFKPLSPRELYTDEEWAGLSRAQQRAVIREEEQWNAPTTSVISVNCDSSTAKFSTPTTANHLYGGRTSWLWNLGYSDEGISAVELTIANPGVYSFDEIEVCVQPMDTLTHFEMDKQSGASGTIENFSFNNDLFQADVVDSNGGFFFISVPYDEGWQATVNGENVDVLRADTAFMAVPLSMSDTNTSYHIELSYHNRYLELYWVAFVSTIVLALAWLFANAKRAHQN